MEAWLAPAHWCSGSLQCWVTHFGQQFFSFTLEFLQKSWVNVPTRVHLVTPALPFCSTTSFIFTWNHSVSRNSLDLRPSQITSAVKTSLEKSLSFSAMALLSPSAPYEPLASCAAAISLDGFLFSFKQLFTVSLVIFCKIFSFIFSHPSCYLLLICFYGLSCSFQQFFKCQPFCLQ